MDHNDARNLAYRVEAHDDHDNANCSRSLVQSNEVACDDQNDHDVRSRADTQDHGDSVPLERDPCMGVDTYY